MLFVHHAEAVNQYGTVVAYTHAWCNDPTCSPECKDRQIANRKGLRWMQRLDADTCILVLAERTRHWLPRFQNWGIRPPSPAPTLIETGHFAIVGTLIAIPPLVFSRACSASCWMHGRNDTFGKR